MFELYMNSDGRTFYREFTETPPPVPLKLLENLPDPQSQNKPFAGLNDVGLDLNFAKDKDKEEEPKEEEKEEEKEPDLRVPNDEWLHMENKKSSSHISISLSQLQIKH
jgi:hypothetical protein